MLAGKHKPKEFVKNRVNYENRERLSTAQVLGKIDPFVGESSRKEADSCSPEGSTVTSKPQEEGECSEERSLG